MSVYTHRELSTFMLTYTQTHTSIYNGSILLPCQSRQIQADTIYRSILEREPSNTKITMVDSVFSQKLPTSALWPFSVVSECYIPGHPAPLTTFFPMLYVNSHQPLSFFCKLSLCCSGTQWPLISLCLFQKEFASWPTLSPGRNSLNDNNICQTASPLGTADFLFRTAVVF